MTQKQPKVNAVTEPITLNPTTANLANVALGLEIAEIAMGRSGHLPGVVCFTGWSGLGKSITAEYIAQQHRGYYVEIRRVWTRKNFLDMIMHVMGIPQEKDLDMARRLTLICSQLGASARPLILDEFDNIMDRPKPAEFIELVRDLIDGSQGAIIIIGEERLPHKLAKSERFHNRILDWKQAVTTSIKDVKILAAHYYPELEIETALLEKVLTSCHGIARRICMNLEAIAREAAERGVTAIGLADWGKRGFNTGAPPMVRELPK